MNLPEDIYPVVGIIPSYQPDEKLAETINASLRALNVVQLIVVDDGGGVQYAELFDRIARLPNVTVLHHGVNAGKGAGIKTAVQYAMWKYPNALGFVVYDGDGQHDPNDVRRVIEAFVAAPEKLVLGVRDFHDPNLHIPFRSQFGNRMTEIIFRFFTGIHLVDTQTGLRCYSRQLAAELTQVNVIGMSLNWKLCS